MRRIVLLVFASFWIASLPAVAGDIAIGFFSFDVLIPAGAGPGVNAFDVYNLTGPVFGPSIGSPYAADSLTLDNATLTVNLQGGSSQLIDLGDIGPGELLDSSGNPVVQFPSTAEFISASLTATLSATTFQLSDGSTFNALPSISVDLIPSLGPLLAPGVDFSPIFAEPASTATPEPSTAKLLGYGLAGIIAFAFFRKRLRQAR